VQSFVIQKHTNVPLPAHFALLPTLKMTLTGLHLEPSQFRLQRHLDKAHYPVSNSAEGWLHDSQVIFLIALHRPVYYQ
jgi:hypothetical protein